ncbi:hypothetical protein [Goekera deserti]|nr:hypothetical protein [Goekera deserti]
MKTSAMRSAASCAVFVRGVLRPASTAVLGERTSWLRRRLPAASR